MYKRVRTPNSPLMPLSPMATNMEANVNIKTPTHNFLSPSLALPRNRIRRSFTPCNSNIAMSPPSVSPIVKRKYATPQNSPSNKVVRRSANTSIKILRSSVRCLYKIHCFSTSSRQFYISMGCNRIDFVISYISLSFFLAQMIPIQIERILDRKKFKCESVR